MRVLGIETSCDETGIAIYDTDHGLLSDCLYSQVKLHADYGGVVPELASRDHVRKIVPLIKQALQQAHLNATDINGIAFTQGPGCRWCATRWCFGCKEFGFRLEYSGRGRPPHGRTFTCANVRG